MNNASHKLFVIAAALLILATALYLSGGCKGKRGPAHPEMRVPVVVEPAAVMDVPDEVRGIGTVEAYNSVSVTSRVGGQVLRVGFTEGQNVVAGNVLFQIDPGPYRAALEAAQANLERDRAGLKKADGDVARYEGLVEKEYITKQDYDAAVSVAGELKATVDADRALVDNARLNVAYCTISAPLSGRTGNLLIKQGDNVTANGQVPLVVINQITPIKVRFSLPEQLLDRIRTAARGSELKVTAALSSDSAKAFEGKLSFVDNAVDTATGTVMLKAVFPNTDRVLWPNQSVLVRLELGTRMNAIVVPEAAVQTSQQGDFVYVATRGDSAAVRPVVTGTKFNDLVVVDKGVKAGERIVVDGQFGLRPGARIAVTASAGAGPGTAERNEGGPQ